MRTWDPAPACLNQSKSTSKSTSWTNSKLSAQNGTITIHSEEDTTISGGNVEGKYVSRNTGGNLILESLQNTSSGNSSSFGVNAEINRSNAGGVNGGSVGGSYGYDKSYRKWVYNIVSITGTNFIKIDTNQFNIIGAKIDRGDNLKLLRRKSSTMTSRTKIIASNRIWIKSGI
jgi:hypothetical protein